MLPDELVTTVFHEGLSGLDNTTSASLVAHVCAVRRTARVGKEAMEHAFLRVCSPTRFATGMLHALLDLTRHDRHALQRTASQTKEYVTRVQQLQRVQRLQRVTGERFNASRHDGSDVCTFVREHLFVFRAQHREVKLLAQTILYAPLCNEVRDARQQWKAEHDRIAREFLDEHPVGTIYYHARSEIHAYLGAPPPLPCRLSSVWEKEVGFVE